MNRFILTLCLKNGRAGFSPAAAGDFRRKRRGGRKLCQYLGLTAFTIPGTDGFYKQIQPAASSRAPEKYLLELGTIGLLYKQLKFGGSWEKDISLTVADESLYIL